MKQITLQIKVFILLILFILPCNAIASEKPEIFVQRGHTSSVNSVAFSHDGKYALSGGLDKTLKLWEVATGKEIRTL